MWQQVHACIFTRESFYSLLPENILASEYTKIVSFSSLHFPPWLILINTMQGFSHEVNLALSDDINHITEQYNDT